MRKNRLIALIGTLTMAAAGLAAVSAGVSSKKADSVSAAVTNGKYRFNVLSNSDNWLQDGTKTLYGGVGGNKELNLPSDFTASSKNSNYVEMQFSGETYYWTTIEMDKRDDFKKNEMWFGRGNASSNYNWFGSFDTWNNFVGNYYDNTVVISGTWDHFSVSGYGWYNKIATHTGLDHNTVNYYLINSGQSPASPTAPAGYTFAGWYTNADCTTAWTATGQHTDINLYAKYTPNTNTAYQVKHYKQNLDGTTYALAETEDKTGTTGQNTAAAAKTYEGFNAPASITQQTIKGDGTTVVEIQYTRKSNNLTWNANGGELSGSYTSGSVKYGTPIVAPTATKDGYDFAGWTGGTVPATMPDEALSFTASWTPKEYTINYLPGTYGVGEPKQGTKTYGVDLTLPNAQFTNENYIQKGWATEDLGEKVYELGGTYSDNTGANLYPYWEEKTKPTYNVDIVANNPDFGSVNPYQVDAVEDDEVSYDGNVLHIGGVDVTATPTTQTETKIYKFTGWTNVPSTITGPTTITANFEEEDRYYDLAWNYGGTGDVTVKTAGTAAGSYLYNADVTAPVLERPGFKLNGWNPAFSNKLTESVTYEAIWGVFKPGIRVLADDTGYGTVSPSGDIDRFTYNSPIVGDGTTLKVNGNVVCTATPHENGPEGTYTFTGWEGIPASGYLTEDTLITAKFSFTPATYILTWNFNGGSTSDTGYTVSGTYPYNTTITAPTDASMSKDGFVFAGWDNQVASKLTSNQTYTAQWNRPNGYYVHVYGDNERFVPMSGTGEVSALVSLTDGEIFKVVHIVDGSETSQHGFNELKYDTGEGACDARTKAQIIDDGEPYHNMKANLPDTNSFTVYYKPAGDGVTDPGIYIPSIVNVEFDLNGVTGEGPENQIVNSRGLVTEPEDPITEEAYEFEGWYADSDCTNKWDFSTYQVVYFTTDDDHVATQKIYANWISTATYNITLDDNGGSGGEGTIENVKEGDEISVTALPEKEKYSFQGYFTATTGGTKVIDSDGSNETPYSSSFGETLYAQWDLDRGTYLTGSFGDADWARDGKYVMTLNPGTENQYVIKGVELKANDELRPYFDTGDYDWGEIDANKITWSHPNYKGEKSGNNCKVLVDGTYDIYYDTVNHSLHLAMPSMPENGRYLAINGDISKAGLKVMTEHQGYTGTEYKYSGEFKEGDKIRPYFQDSTQATIYDATLRESIKIWEYVEGQGLICPEDGYYSIYLINSAAEGQPAKYDEISIFQEGESGAIAYAEEFANLMEEVCDADGATGKKDLQDAWATAESKFDLLDDTAKNILKNATAASVVKGMPEFAERYDYIYNKYGADYELSNFIDRSVSSSARSHLISINNVSDSTWIIASVAIVGIAAVGVFFIYRKRKEN